MARNRAFVLFILILVSVFPAAPVLAQEDANTQMLAQLDCLAGPHTPQPDSAYFLMCLPPNASQAVDLVIYAHGYVDPNQPIGPVKPADLTLPDGTFIPAVVTGLGYAFATTTYRTNGLAVLQGVQDILELVDIFKKWALIKQLVVNNIFLVGFSEGGLITTLAVEQNPKLFSGGLAACGPIGDMRRQINYWGDLRAVFDYFFEDKVLIPEDAVNINPLVMTNWETIFKPAILGAIASDPLGTAQLLRVSKAPFDPTRLASIAETVLGVLWYNAFATNDGKVKLGGQPFDNTTRMYWGSLDDAALNKDVKRYSADPAALEALKPYQTSGVLRKPLVTLHTLGDPIVPYWHVSLYRYKLLRSGSSWYHMHLPLLRYGHCTFKVSEIVTAFGLLVWRATGKPLANPLAVLPDDEARAQFTELYQTYMRKTLTERQPLPRR